MGLGCGPQRTKKDEYHTRVVERGSEKEDGRQPKKEHEWTRDKVATLRTTSSVRTKKDLGERGKTSRGKGGSEK